MGLDAWSYWAEIGQGFIGAVRLLTTGDPETWATIRQSLVISVSATLASMVLGVPLGAWLAGTKFPGRGVGLMFLLGRRDKFCSTNILDRLPGEHSTASDAHGSLSRSSFGCCSSSMAFS